MKRNKIIFIGILSSLLIYGSIITIFIFAEPLLVYHPNYPSRKVREPHDSLHIFYKKVIFDNNTGNRLKGWIIPSLDDSSHLWILFCHGNAGNISNMGYPERYFFLHKLHLNIFTFDYRGYGESEGILSEAGLYDDALAAYHYLTNKIHVDSKHIIIYGYSLGSGVAAHLATQVSAGGLILEGAYTSIPNVGAEQYPWLPIHLIARNRYETEKIISTIEIPKLIIHAKDDLLIPLHHGRTLFEKANQPKTFLLLTGGHNDAPHQDALHLYNGINIFIKKNKF